jgi:hypothetical protein
MAKLLRAVLRIAEGRGAKKAQQPQSLIAKPCNRRPRAVGAPAMTVPTKCRKDSKVHLAIDMLWHPLELRVMATDEQYRAQISELACSCGIAA